jgi:DNA-binding response OmpR family regulator
MSCDTQGHLRDIRGTGPTASNGLAARKLRAAPAPGPRGERTGTVPRTLHIAIAESDDLIRQLLSLWLQEAGHSTHVIAPGPAAARPFDLVIANVSSPRTAAPVVRTLRATHGGAPLLLLSARFGRTPSAALAQQLGVAATLAKPFTRQELMAAIGCALP